MASRVLPTEISSEERGRWLEYNVILGMGMASCAGFSV